MYQSLELSEEKSYNVLITQTYLMIIPRIAESSHDFSMNTLAFAGSFFNTRPERLAKVKEVGPINMLKAVTLPRE